MGKWLQPNGQTTVSLKLWFQSDFLKGLNAQDDSRTCLPDTLLEVYPLEGRHYSCPYGGIGTSEQAVQSTDASRPYVQPELHADHQELYCSGDVTTCG